MYYTATAPPEPGYPPLLHTGGTGGTHTRVFPCRSTAAVGTQPTRARRGSRATSSRKQRNPAQQKPAEACAALRHPQGGKDAVQAVQRSRRLLFLFTHRVLGLGSTKEKLSCTAFPHATWCLCVARGEAKCSPRPPAPRATPGLSPPVPTPKAQLGSGQPAWPLPYGRPQISRGKLVSLCRVGQGKSTHLNAAPKRERREGKSALETTPRAAGAGFATQPPPAGCSLAGRGGAEEESFCQRGKAISSPTHSERAWEKRGEQGWLCTAQLPAFPTQLLQG